MPTVNHEVLRSSFTCEGTRVFLVHDPEKGLYRLGTRWFWLTAFESVWDACDAFDGLELMTGDEREIARILKAEIKRVPRHSFGKMRGSMKRINYLVNSAERRMQGLRPQRCGSKGSVERWIAA